jgi:hypothetical protein
MTWKHSRLVRVRWVDRRSKRTRKFVAGVLARDQEHAYDIAECVVGCMVPPSLQLDVTYSTAILDREARVADAHSEYTPWEVFERYSQGVKALPKERGR